MRLSADHRNHTGIAVFGPFGVGKDFILQSVADACHSKDVATSMLSFGRYFYDVLAKEHGYSVEYIVANKAQFRGDLQRLGLNPQYQDEAVRALVDQVQRQSGSTPPFFLLQGRRKQEVEAARALGMYILGIQSSETVRLSRIATRDGRVPSVEERHAGTEVDPFDLGCDSVFLNEGPLDIRLDITEGIMQILGEEGQGCIVQSSRLSHIGIESIEGGACVGYNPHI